MTVAARHVHYRPARFDDDLARVPQPTIVELAPERCWTVPRRCRIPEPTGNDLLAGNTSPNSSPIAQPLDNERPVYDPCIPDAIGPRAVIWWLPDPKAAPTS
eukprot:gene3422-biopygen1354